MKSIFLNSLSIVWLGLLAATGLTAWLAETERGIPSAMAFILVIAALKIALIMDHFMELRHAPAEWRLTMFGWLLAASAIVLSDYWLR